MKATKRRSLPVVLTSGKFVLSDITDKAAGSGAVVSVSWVESAEIASLVEEISI